MSAVRILNVVPTLMCGGTENQFMTLGRLLNRDRFDLEFACLRRWGPFVKELADMGTPLAEYRVATFRSLTALAQQAKLARHIARKRIQIVHAYSFYGNVFAIPPARVVAPVVIASIRDCAPYLTTMQKRVQRHICRFADCVLVNADAVKDWLIGEGYNPAKIVVIRNGVDLRRFAGQPEPDRIRHELGLPLGTPLVAVVSRLTPLKGIEQFLEAAGGLRMRFPDVRFLIVGETSPDRHAYLGRLKDLTQRLGLTDRVIFTGLRSDVPALLASVTVSVMPSLNEALSNVLLESMAAGAPVVATRVGGTPEALVDGVSGLIVPPGDSAALAASITRVLEDADFATRLGRAAREVVATRFSVERMVQSTEQLYDDLLARKQPQSLLSVVTDRPRPALTAARGCSVELVTDEAAFLGLEKEWNETVESAGMTHPFLRHEWMRTWWESFSAGRRLHIYVVRSSGKVVAIAPLMSETKEMYGVPVRRLSLLHNDHTPRADFIVADQTPESYRAIWGALRNDPSRWDVLELGRIAPDSPTLDAMDGLAEHDGCATGRWHGDVSPYLPLTGTWDGYQASLTAKFRSNVRNRLSRLTRLGVPAIEVIRDRGEILGACDEALRLEASGWKRDTGTAICSEPAVERFYQSLAERATERNWMRLLFLTVNGRRIATSYASVYANRLFLFKTGYDPEFAACSPFKLLAYHAIRDAYAEGLSEVDFLGDAEPWKLDWTSSTRPHDWLFIFSGSRRAQLLHKIKFQVVPELRRWRA